MLPRPYLMQGSLQFSLLVAKLAVALFLVFQNTPAMAQAAANLSPEVAAAIRFSINEIRIEGNTLVSGTELDAAVKPLAGSGRSVDDLNAVKQAILDAYRNHGYELLSVTYDGARSRSGTHYFVVHELRIGKVRVSGNSALSEIEVRRSLPGLAEGSTPQLGQLARELFLFNDNPGRKALLEYSSANPGITDVNIRIAEQPQLRTALTFNNSGTSATGKARIGAYASHSSFLGRSHQVSASVSTSDRPSHVLQAGFSYLVPLPSLGDSVQLSASYSDVDSGRIADAFNISGKGSTWGVHYLRNLARDMQSRHVLDLGYDERRYRDIVDFFGTNLGASVTVKPLAAGYRYGRAANGASLSAGISLQHNLPGGDRNTDADYARSRAGAAANWQSWQLDAAWQRELASGWQPAATLAAQYTSAPLIPSEQFGLGGLRSVRGFGEREVTGDRGWRASLELYGPPIAGTQRLLGFVDFGAAARLNPQLGELPAQHISSGGVGWRAQLWKALTIAADYAVVAHGTASSPNGKQMLHVSAAWSF